MLYSTKNLSRSAASGAWRGPSKRQKAFQRCHLSEWILHKWFVGYFHTAVSVHIGKVLLKRISNYCSLCYLWEWSGTRSTRALALLMRSRVEDQAQRQRKPEALHCADIRSSAPTVLPCRSIPAVSEQLQTEIQPDCFGLSGMDFDSNQWLPSQILELTWQWLFSAKSIWFNRMDVLYLP